MRSIERIAIVGTAGSGKTYAAKGFVERLLESGARVAIVDPLGVWWGLRAGADGAAPGYPVVVFGGRHADVAITAEMGTPLGRLIAGQALACVVDLSELGSSTARRRFMAAFAEALYEANEEPLHLVLDEADLWAPQRPIKGWESLLGHIEEIVRRGRVRGFIPWLITQRPAVVHKDVLSQADILIAMKLTASQDRDAIGAWIEGQADRQDGKRILGDLPRLKQGEGYLWAPGHGLLKRVRFPAIRTFDSSRTPRRGERLAVPRTLASVDLTAIVAALAAETPDAGDTEQNHPRYVRVARELTAARERIAALEQENRELAGRLEGIAALAAGLPRPGTATADQPTLPSQPEPPPVKRTAASPPAAAASTADGGLHLAARKLLAAVGAARARPLHLGPARDPGRAQAERRALQLRAQGVARSRLCRRGRWSRIRVRDKSCHGHAGRARGGGHGAGRTLDAGRAAGAVVRAAAGAGAGDAAHAGGGGGQFMEVAELAAALGKKPSGGHWNSGIAVLRNNGLIETEPAAGTPGSKRYRVAALFRE